MGMKLNIQKWGNSAAVRLPVSMLAQLGVHIGDTFEVDLDKDAVTLRVAKPKYRLADLLAEMPDGLPMVEGWDALPPAGRETC
ncbi:MAG: antitoxin ChpS [Betaproteobacteria bacterium ADurb.Bin341]|nr:MAG: antitoxin ChpS [Betaproteobacteria bacterium ADurb.Bin341]